MNKEALKLYAVTDRGCLKNGISLPVAVELAIKGGVTMVQLREKEMDHDSLVKEALEVKEVCRKYNVPFIVNDDVYLAKETDADGVHVGQDDMNPDEVRKILGKDKIVGVTAKTVEQAQLAEKAGADYLGSGAVFGSTTKKDARYMTMETLESITTSVSIPVVAIGGINKNNVHELRGTHIAGVAVVSGIFGEEDIEGGARELLKGL
ncbi:MAG: thiamine phosphate synthase [Lachnospiraceae bacterium]|nr:thiamine phosphate synthase [Lachnospiraceae bacterium]